MEDFANKVAVITGGASGIGFATAQALARAGAKLVLADIEQNALDTALESLRADKFEASGCITNVADRDAVHALADLAWSTYGQVDIVMNNAGVAVFGPTHEMTHEDWDWLMQVNLWGCIHGVEAFVPKMVAAKAGGHVLFTASFAGLVPNRDLGCYNVTKAATIALAESLHKDVRDEGIGVSVLCPMRVTSDIDFSNRNRPADLGGPQANRTYTEEERASLNGATLPVEPVAELVLDAMRRNDLYIHTHKMAAKYFSRRAERISDAFEYALGDE
ncbi:MAG: SDR family NAD(P)-dependent oxidoreductase [Gammaproteobacteria bacterium]